MKEETSEQDARVVVEETMIPIKNPEVTVREEIEEDGKYILFNADNELILVINPTGKLILDNCTGAKTIAQIIEDIKINFRVNQDMDLVAVVKSFISTLVKAELIMIKEEER